MIIKFIKFIYNDIKTDIQFIIGIFQGKPVAEKKINQYKTEMQQYGGLTYKGISNLLMDIIKTQWMLFIMLFLFFVAGMWYAQQDCQDNCNTFILENYVSKIGDELVYKNNAELAKEYQFKPLNFTVG